MSRPFIQLGIPIGAENVNLAHKLPVMGIQQKLLDFATSSGIGEIIRYDNSVKVWRIPGEAAEALAGILGCKPCGHALYNTVINRFYDADALAVRAEQKRLVDEMRELR